MARREGSVHVAVTRRHYKGREYTTTLLRRSFREGGKVRNETVGNLSHLPDWVIASIRSMLAGRRLVDLDDGFEITRSLPHGHVRTVLDVINDLGLPGLLCRERCRERDLCLAMICQRAISPCSKLSMTRLLSQSTLSEELQLGKVSENDLLAGMDWLLKGQPRVERALAKRHLTEDGFVLYDLSSSYLEGRHCELAAHGYSRDEKRGKLQIEYGLCCSPEGRPVSVSVFDGNTGDPATLENAVNKVKKDFGINDIVFVGDRGMITQARTVELKKLGVGFVTALRAPQIQKLLAPPGFQLSLLDERNLCEISSPEFPGERLVVCRNPALGAERARKRQALLAATEVELEKIETLCSNRRSNLHGAPAATIAERVGRVINKKKIGKHFTFTATDGAFTFKRNTESIEGEARFDGIYVLRTDQPTGKLNTQTVVRAYKNLKVNERSFKAMKSTLDIRPIHHRLAVPVQGV